MLTRYLIVCPLVFLAAFIDSVAGGGALISLPAYMMGGLPVHMAIGTNKVSSFMGTSMAIWRFAKKGFIPWKPAGCCAVFAMAGSSVGANLALLISPDIFKVIMLVILPLVALYVMRPHVFEESPIPCSPRRTLAVGVASAFFIGMYDGFYGPGTGTFLILVLTGLARLKLTEANGVTKVINLSTGIAALAVYLTNGKVDLALGLAAGCFSIGGSYLGTRFFERGGSKSVRLVIPVVLALFFIKIITELL